MRTNCGPLSLPFSYSLRLDLKKPRAYQNNGTGDGYKILRRDRSIGTLRRSLKPDNS